MVDSLIRVPRLDAGGKIPVRFLPTLTPTGSIFARDYITATQTPDQRTAQVQKAVSDAIAAGVDLCFDNLPGASIGVPLAVNAPIVVPQRLRLWASGQAALLQTTHGQPLFRTATAGCRFEGLVAVGQGLDIGPLGSHDVTAICAGFLLEPGAHYTQIIRCGAVDYLRGVGFAGVADTDPLLGLVVDDFEVQDVWCGVFGREMTNTSLNNIRGTYKPEWTSVAGVDVDNPCHLVYLTGYQTLSATEYRPRNRNVRVTNCSAHDSVGGHAYSFKGIFGLYYDGLSADGCDGILDMIGVFDSTLGSYASTNDRYPRSGARASVTIKYSRRVEIGAGLVQFAAGDHGRAYFTEAANVQVRNVGMRIVCNSTVARGTIGTDFQYSAVRLAASGSELIDVDVTNVGQPMHSAVFVVGTGDSQRVQTPRIGAGFTVGVLVDKQLSGVVVEYDPSRIAAASDLRLLNPGVTTASMPRLANTRRAPYPGDTEQMTAWADPEIISITSDTLNDVWQSGHVPAVLTGSWAIDEVGIFDSTNAAATNAVSVGSANVEVSTVVRLGGATARAGILLRAASATTALEAVIDSTGKLVLAARSGDARTVLAEAPTRAVAGRRYPLRVVAVDSTVQVFLAGVLMLTHILSDANAATYGSGTAHGIVSASGADSRFSRVTIRRFD